MSTYEYLGPVGTFTEAALKKITSASDALIPYANVTAALMAVREGKADFALAPIENSVEGASDIRKVGADLFARTNGKHPRHHKHGHKILRTKAVGKSPLVVSECIRLQKRNQSITDYFFSDLG